MKGGDGTWAAQNSDSCNWFHLNNVMGTTVDRQLLRPWARNWMKVATFHFQSSPMHCNRITAYSMGLIMAHHILKQAIVAGALLLAPVLTASQASAQVLSYAPSPQSYPSDDALPPQVSQPSEDSDTVDVVPERFRRAIVAYDSREAPGTVVIDTANTQLYYVLGNGRAMRYGVGVGREGFTWSGTQTVTRKAEWPDWTPPSEMIARQPYLPRFMAGGPGNPLGARAMYLGSSIYRIHGTNDPSTIGKFVSSGCIRLTNDDVADLFSRVTVGTKVVVLPKAGVRNEARASKPLAAKPLRQAMNLTTQSIY